MYKPIEKSWLVALEAEFSKPYYQHLTDRVSEAYQHATVYPTLNTIFAAFDHTPLPSVNVVILGQDPYHGYGQAHGLAFSVLPDTPIPPSLANIYKEIQSDIGRVVHTSGSLLPWAKQGVLLLNSTLTVEAGLAGSHQNFGWDSFTDHVIQTVSTTQTHVVFLLWGNHAQSKKSLIDVSKHCILTAPHPSPLSAYRGFFGCKHFSQCNAYLAAHGRTPITW